MLRTKAWWARLTKEERSELVRLERGDRWYFGRSVVLPDGCSECGNCSALHVSGGLCHICRFRLRELLAKAKGERALAAEADAKPTD